MTGPGPDALGSVETSPDGENHIEGEPGGADLISDLISEAARIGSAKRIHITGGPGTGKSTLARGLGAKLGVPVYGLDSVAYEGPEFTERPSALCAAETREIAEQPQWITEGIFIGWTDSLLQRAEVIIWLDYLSWPSAAARIIVRTLRGALRELKVRRRGQRFRRIADYRRNTGQLISVLVDSRDYWSRRKAARRYPVTREAMDEALSAHAPKVVHITRKQEVETLANLLVTRHAER